MSILAISLAMQLLAASPSESQGPNVATGASITELRTEVRATLRRHALAQGPERVVVLKELIALYQQIGVNQQIAPGARQQLQGVIGARLQRSAKNDDYGPDLVELIEHTIAPGSWESQGGPGRIFYWRNGRALVISQTQQTHTELADLLAQLHDAGN